MSVVMKNGQLKLSKWLEILFTFVGAGDATFHYKLFPLRFLKELFKANLRIFSLLMDSEFRCRLLIFLMMKIDIRIISGNFRVNRKLSF